MKNILRDPVSRDELVALLKDCPVTAILPPMGSTPWRECAGNTYIREWLNVFQRAAAHEISEPLPALTDDLYAEFCKNGNRLNFERPYFERRRMLGRAALAQLTSDGNDDAMRRSLLTKMQGIFDEVSWALPAHVWQNPTGKNPKCIDLFCAETANLFGELLNLFGAIIPDDFQKRIYARLRADIFENYAYQDHHWLRITNNWNAVCHQGVIGAALSVENDPELLADMLLKMRENLPRFIDGFNNDGGTTEGPGYWSYGFGWFAFLNSQLETRTRNELSLFDGDKKVLAMARFGPQMVLANNHLVNFSDGGATGILRPSLIDYLAQRLNDAMLQKTADNCWAATFCDFDCINDLRADLFYLVRMVLMAPKEKKPAELSDVDLFLPDTQWLLTRSRDQSGRLWELAAKAGHNDEHHNHNDVGSYLLNIDGQRIIVEIGAPEYTREFFSDKRYQSLAARSLGHSVPLVNGVEQHEGSAFRGHVLSHSFTPVNATFVADLTMAYPPEARLQKSVRYIHFDKYNGFLKIQDEYELKSGTDIESAIIVPVEPMRQADGVVLHIGGKLYGLRPEAGTQISDIQAHSYHDHQGTPRDIYRIVLRLIMPAQRGTIACRLRPI